MTIAKSVWTRLLIDSGLSSSFRRSGIGISHMALDVRKLIRSKLTRRRLWSGGGGKLQWLIFDLLVIIIKQ
ncbi:hypothetical protein BDV23DRAFT_159039 [Aspergillus alliaceus]|uniref:Uncharacterized protein n=1 Tax=Petromyces alliaceus TaxID=209559 RepID=A0A5N7C2W2_PETAA|nr:hypothetical protein BDV23DRAFT_159039 [Aspergillus alliaceus]